nr:9752_t:CDS:2 [Entrophospora candida]
MSNIPTTFNILPTPVKSFPVSSQSDLIESNHYYYNDHCYNDDDDNYTNNHIFNESPTPFRKINNNTNINYIKYNPNIDIDHCIKNYLPYKIPSNDNNDGGGNFYNGNNNNSGSSINVEFSRLSTGFKEIITPTFNEPLENPYKCFDVSEHSTSLPFNNTSNNSSEISGFTTGSGKKIAPISKESKERAYKCLGDSKHTSSPPSSDNILNTTSGFSTGFKRKIKSISKESMKVSEHSSSSIKPSKENDMIKKSRKNQHSNSGSKHNSNNYKKPPIRSHQPNLKLRTPLRNTIGNMVYHHPLTFNEQDLLNFEITPDVLYINPSNATLYNFTWPKLFLKSNCQQQQKATWGPNEALSCLIKCGANPNLIDQQWVLNHYKWIVWKISSMIRSYPNLFHCWLSSDTVLDQLRYRYEREINRTQGSALKSIIEGNASPAWPMVLCVSDIIDDKTTPLTPPPLSSSFSMSPTPPFSPVSPPFSYMPNSSSSDRKYIDGSKLSLELTDGWYKINACIDPPLQRAIMKSKIKMGYKLEICGAKVYGKSVGKTSALDETNSICLKLSGNSTKLAHWDSKLGFRKFRPFASLNSLTPDGGFIFAIDVIIMRKYPLMYRETTKDGIYIIRNEKGEELARRNFAEKIQGKIQSLLQDYDRRSPQQDSNKLEINDDNNTSASNAKFKQQKQVITKQLVQNLTSAEELYNLLQNNSEYSNRIIEYLSFDQSRWLNDWLNRKEMSNLNERNKWLNEQLESVDLKSVRSVIPFFKVRVCDYHSQSKAIRKAQSKVNREALITIWNPASSLYDSIHEGQRYQIHSLMVANNQSYDPNLSSTISLIHLTSIGHTTIWRKQKADLNEIRNSLYRPRAVTIYDEAYRIRAMAMTIRTGLVHQCQEEHDIVVVVLAVGEIVEKIRYGITIEIQTAIATDISGQFVFIEFNKSFFIDLDNLLIPKNILTIINLRHAYYDSNYRVHMLSTCDVTVIKQFPCEDYLKQARSRLESWVKVNGSILSVYESNAKKLCKSLSP